jgi:hypothetical protein
MNRNDIKYKLRESLTGLFEDSEENGPNQNIDKKENDDDSKNDKVEYDDIVNFFDKHNSIKQVGVFREAGFSEDDIYSRLPYKKLNQEKNEMGGVYRFDKDEVDRLRTVLSKYPGGGKISR